jgi:magnesium-transporting ATPase (P-type)
VLFWFITTTRYLLVALAACFLSLVTSLLIIQLFNWDDASYVAPTLFWLFAFLAEGSLLVPLSLAITAELVERKVQSRLFSWRKARRRFLIAVPMVIAPWYAGLCFVMGTVENRRPAHWFETAVLLCCVSAVFAYLGLRIRKPRMQPLPESKDLSASFGATTNLKPR